MIKNLIDHDIIKTYNLEDEEFECPVCNNYYKSLIFNNHYNNCYLKYTKKIQDEINQKNKEIEIENNNNYYKSIFEYLFSKLNDVDFSKNLMNYKLEFIDIDFSNVLFVINNNIKNLNKNYNNVILLHENNNIKGSNKTYLINNNINYDYINYHNSILFLNSDNLYKKNINELIKNYENNEIIYFSDINIINFISNLLNIKNNSKLIFLFYLIKILDDKIDVYFNPNNNNNILNNEEIIYLEHLERLNYINLYNNEHNINNSINSHESIILNNSIINDDYNVIEESNIIVESNINNIMFNSINSNIKEI
jgi:hypothetical protein